MLGIVVVTLSLALLSLYVRSAKVLGIVNACGYAVVFALALLLAATGGGYRVPDFFYADGLSVFFVFTVALVSLVTAFYSSGYIRHAVEEGSISAGKAAFYYVLFNLFCCAMFLTVMVKNLGLMWVAIEMTTLVSAFLVGFYNTKQAIEAAWKYVIICSVGIILALFGIIIFYSTVANHAGLKNLNWPDIVNVAKTLNPNVVRIAFLFILVGFGTKAGIAPMHTWLPDAHSQAVSPISALLSGVLLKTSLYAILRFSIITNMCVGERFTSHLFILFGLISLVVSAGFILVQKNLKRLLAYSSIEHIGVIVFGLGIAGPWALYGAFLHILGHAAIKPVMFFGAASVLKKYKTENMHIIRGIVTSLPFTGIVLTLGVFALGGMPPFSLFVSEIYIVVAGFMRGSYVVTAVYVACIVAVFCSLTYHFGKILFGKKPVSMEAESEPFLAKAAFIMLLTFAFAIGIAAPGVCRDLILKAIQVVTG